METDRFFEKYNIHLNAGQKQAVLHKAGPALVLAGPGSGKTTVITARCAYLINAMNSNLTPPGGILTVAFNKAAAEEMSNRYKKIYNDIHASGNKISFSTFHSFCNSVISQYEKLNNINYTRLPEKGEEVCKENILDRIYRDINNIELTKTELNKLSNELGKIKNNIGPYAGPDSGAGGNSAGSNSAGNSGIDPNAVLSMSNFKKVDIIYRTYEKYKSDNNYIDFDDMLYMAKGIFERNPRILKEIQKEYLYYQVDEGQDLSEVQLDIVKILSRNVFIVGDDDQGIYGFRGAKPEAVVNIEKYFSNCAIYYLKQNYRSTEKIVDFSGKFIKQNAVRFDKNFITDLGKGKKPKCKVFMDDSELLAFIYAKISSPKSGSAGILYRNGASCTLPMIMCCKNNIPFKISGGTGIFFDSFVSGDILDLFLNERDRKNIFQSKPETVLRNFIFDGYLERMKYKCEKLSLRFPDMLRYLCAWEYLVKGLRNSGQVIDAYNEMKNINAAAAAMSGEASGKAAGAETGMKPGTSSGTKVHLSTIHSAKGLEYDTVFMIDLYKGEFPKNCGEEELCEERRLFYVGMTRAKKFLYMMYPLKRIGVKLEPGEFFNSVCNL